MPADIGHVVIGSKRCWRSQKKSLQASATQNIYKITSEGFYLFFKEFLQVITFYFGVWHYFVVLYVKSEIICVP